MPGESDQQADIERLFARLREVLPEMRNLAEECVGHRGYEDPIYRYFLEMAVRYGEKEGSSPRPFPSGWAALLELYGLR